MEHVQRLERLIERVGDPKGRLAAAIAAELAASLGPGALGSVETVRVKPGRRALLRLQWRRAEAEAVPVLAKIRAKAPDHAAAAIQQRVSRLSADGFPFALMLGEVPKGRLWLQSDLGGESGAAFLARGGDPALFGARSAAAVRRLHESAVELEREWTPADERAVLDRALDRLASGAPLFAETARRLRARSASRLGEIAPGSRPIHRDFYMDQVQVTSIGFALVDLDLAALGDPAQDAGNFLAHLDEWALREPCLAPGLKEAARAFEGGLDPSLHVRTRVESWRALSLVRLGALSQTLPERAPFTAAILAAAERQMCGD